MKKTHNLSEEEKQNIAEVVGVSSVKYADLSQNKQSDILFEWDKMLSLKEIQHHTYYILMLEYNLFLEK